MQEDKELKELLMKWAVEDTAADFTSQVMQQVTLAYNIQQHNQPLFKQKLPRVVLGAFIGICVMLFAISIIFPATTLPFQFNVKLPERYCWQSFQFLAVFWIVMLFNLVLKRYSLKF